MSELSEALQQVKDRERHAAIGKALEHNLTHGARLGEFIVAIDNVCMAAEDLRIPSGHNISKLYDLRDALARAKEAKEEK